MCQQLWLPSRETGTDLWPPWGAAHSQEEAPNKVPFWARLVVACSWGALVAPWGGGKDTRERCWDWAGSSNGELKQLRPRDVAVPGTTMPITTHHASWLHK